MTQPPTINRIYSIEDYEPSLCRKAINFVEPRTFPGKIDNTDLADIKKKQTENKWPVLAYVHFRPFYFLRNSNNELIYADDDLSAKI